jgi:HSP20 family molecular chaperone IbpA
MFEYRSLLDRPFTDPFGWDDVFRGFDRILRDADRDIGLASTGDAPARFDEETDKFVLRVEVPGVAEKDVHVDFQDGVLTVSAERQVTEPEGFTPRRRERGSQKFSRSYALGERADAEKTTAELKDGVLTVSIGKAAVAQKKSIAVKAA